MWSRHHYPRTQSAEVPMQCETPEPEQPPNAECENVEEIPEETADEDLEADRDLDRNIEHNLVGRKIKALYDNGGWYTGRITLFNNEMEKLRVEYEDGTEDYIYESDIEVVEISFIFNKKHFRKLFVLLCVL